EYDQLLDPALVCERTRPAGDFHAVTFEMAGEIVEGPTVRDLPSVEGGAFAGLLVHDQTLLAVVHPEREAGAALVDELHAEEGPSIVPPFLEPPGPDPDVSERLQVHGVSLRGGAPRLFEAPAPALGARACFARIIAEVVSANRGGGLAARLGSSIRHREEP